MTSKEGLLFGTAGIPRSSKALTTQSGIERISVRSGWHGKKISDDYEDYLKFKPPSKAIHKACIDFGGSADDVKEKIDQLKEKEFEKVKVAWQGTRMHFLTESIYPDIASPERPRVMLLFSNPHPDSVEKGLFMSEKSSIGFWKILRDISCLDIKHNFCWDSNDSIQKTVSLLLNGRYGNCKSPLLFFDCLYQIPSRLPDYLKKLFIKSGDFDSYIHRPSLERIGKIINKFEIKTVLVFERETFDSIVAEPGASKCSREILRFSVKNANGNEEAFWKCIDKSKLRRIAALQGLNHSCTAIKVIDTRGKDWWKDEGQGHSVFSRVLEYSLKYAAETT